MDTSSQTLKPGQNMITIGGSIQDILDRNLFILNSEELSGNIKVIWNNRMTRAMGKATYKRNYFDGNGHGLIHLSVPLFARASPEQQMETIVHELCHVVAIKQFGRHRYHGPIWKNFMWSCGYPNASRCHTVDRTGLTTKYQAYCDCPNGVKVGPIVYRRLAAGTSYRCRTCKSSLKLELS